MTELVLTRGLPASGKSTWALEWVSLDPLNRVRVGRDPLRDTLYGKRENLTQEQENFITKVQTKAVETALSNGQSVVIDDMHLRKSYITKWRNLAARKGYGFWVQDFDTDPEVCIHRDDARRDWVGSTVIRRLAARFPASNWPVIEPLEDVWFESYVPDETLPMAIIVDIDGTVARHNRSPYDYSLLHTDEVIENVRDLILMVQDWGCTVIFMSGRPDTYRAETEEWLERVTFWDALYMRAAEDQRDDALVKYELFDKNVRNKYNVRFVLDDRDRVVEMWRRIGLTCLQVAPGDF